MKRQTLQHTNRKILIQLASLALLLAACSQQPVYPSPPISGRDAVINISMLKQEVPQFFTYRFAGKNISFFVLKLNDHVLSFFDACASCYPSKLGYRYKDGQMICRSCELNFSIHKLEQGIGGCFPIKIEGKMEKERYLIPLASLEAEAAKF